MRWFTGVAVFLVAVGLVSIEGLNSSRHWLDQHLNQLSLAITTFALLTAAYAAAQARRAVIQSTRFRDIDRLEDIRDEVLKLAESACEAPPQSSAFRVR